MANFSRRTVSACETLTCATLSQQSTGPCVCHLPRIAISSHSANLACPRQTSFLPFLRRKLSSRLLSFTRSREGHAAVHMYSRLRQEGRSFDSPPTHNDFTHTTHERRTRATKWSQLVEAAPLNTIIFVRTFMRFLLTHSIQDTRFAHT